MFDDITSLRGAAGVRIGGDFAIGNGARCSPFIGIHAIEEFDGDARNTFTLGQTIALVAGRAGHLGEVERRPRLLRPARLEVFVRGELDFGGERDGLSGRAGVRLRF